MRDGAINSSAKPVCRHGCTSLLSFYEINTNASGITCWGYAIPTVNLAFHHFCLLHNLKKVRLQLACGSKPAPTADTYTQSLSNYSQNQKSWQTLAITKQIYYIRKFTMHHCTGLFVICHTHNMTQRCFPPATGVSRMTLPWFWSAHSTNQPTNQPTNQIFGKCTWIFNTANNELHC